MLREHLNTDEIIRMIEQLPASEIKRIEVQLKKKKSASRQAKKKTIKRKGGFLKGLVKYMADDFDAPLEDFKEYM